MRTAKQKVLSRYPEARSVGKKGVGWMIVTSNHPSDFVCLVQGLSIPNHAWAAAWERIKREDALRPALRIPELVNDTERGPHDV